jgi:penicillin-binding protein 1A
LRSQHRLQNIVKNVWCGKPSITILAEDGSIVARYGDITGAIINAAQLPPHVLQAVMAVEDRRFYSHFGVDPVGLLRKGA